MSGAVHIAGFAALLAAAVTLELRARRGPPGTASLSDVPDVLTRHPTVRAAALIGWLWLGWHLFVR